MRIRVQVTATDIRHGLRFSSRNCPAARAIVRALRRKLGRRAWLVCGPGLWVRSKLVALLPRGVTRRIARYDATGRMSPFAFDLTLTEAR